MCYRLSRCFSDLEYHKKLEEAHKKICSMEAEIEIVKSHCCHGGNFHNESCVEYLKKISAKEIERDTKWAEKVSVWKGLETKYINKIKELQSNLIKIQKSQQLEMAVQSVCKDVEKDYCQELEQIRGELAAENLNKTEKKFNDLLFKLRQNFTSELDKMSKNYEEMHNKQIDKLTTKLKPQELEAVWNNKLELEEKHKKEIKELQMEWEKKLVDTMSSSLADSSINKVCNIVF